MANEGVIQENINLFKTGFYGEHYSFYNRFKEYGIKTLGDLKQFNSEELFGENEVDMRREFYGFVHLINFKYYGDDLPNKLIEILDKPMKVSFDGMSYFPPRVEELQKLGFSKQLISYIFNSISWGSFSEETSEPRLINILLYIGDKLKKNNSDIPDQQKLIKIIALLYRAYIIQSENTFADDTFTDDFALMEDDNDLEHIKYLKEQLDGLLSIRKSIDNQVEFLQHAYSSLKGQTLKEKTKTGNL